MACKMSPITTQYVQARERRQEFSNKINQYIKRNRIGDHHTIRHGFNAYFQNHVETEFRTAMEAEINQRLARLRRCPENWTANSVAFRRTQFESQATQFYTNIRQILRSKQHNFGDDSRRYQALLDCVKDSELRVLGGGVKEWREFEARAEHIINKNREDQRARRKHGRARMQEKGRELSHRVRNILTPQGRRH